MATRGKASEKKSKPKRGKEKQESLKSPLPITEDSHDSMSSTSTGGEPASKPSKKKWYNMGKKSKKSRSSSSQSSMTADGTRSSPELHSPLADATSSHTHAESSFGPEELPSEHLEEEEEEEEEVFRDGQQAMKMEMTKSCESDEQAKGIGVMEPEEFLKNQIESELERRAAEFEVKIEGEATLEKLQSIFNASAAKHEEALQKVKDSELLAKSHRKTLDKSHTQDVQSMKEALQSIREEKETLQTQLQQREDEILSVMEQNETMRKQCENESRLRSQHADEVCQLKKQVEQLQEEKEAASKRVDEHETELKELNEKHSRNDQALQRVRQQCTQLEEEKKQLHEAVEKTKEQLQGAQAEREEKQLQTDVEQKAKIGDLEHEVTKLKQNCMEKDQMITDLSKKAEEQGDVTERMQESNRRFADQVLNLEQQLQEETQKRIECEERMKLMSNSATASREQNKNAIEGIRQELRKKEEELEEARHQLQQTKEQLSEQETKREESQRSLESLQKAFKKVETSSTKSTTDLDTYFEQITKMTEELNAVYTQSEQRKKEIAGLKRVVKNAEKIEAAYVQTTTKLSETEADVKRLQTELSKAERAEDKRSKEVSSRSTGASPSDVDEKLRQEIRDLKDKLKARDEEVSDLKKHGDNPLSNPPFSPTNSVEASTVEVATLKKKLKEKEQEVQNLKAQVGAVEGVLKQGQHLHKESEKLKQEIEKLKQDKQTLQDHSKKQSQEVFTLKQSLEMLQASKTAVMESEEEQKWRNEADNAQQDMVAMKAKVLELTKELDDITAENEKTASAFREASDQAQHYQHLYEEIVTLKGTAEAERARLQAENDTLKQEVADEKRSAQNILAAEQKWISRADSAIQKELHRLKEETHQKDLLLQSAAEEDEKRNARLQDLQTQLAKAQASYKELSECNEDLIRNQHQMVQEQLQHKNQELEKMQQEVQAKTAQVKQYKKQIDILQEKQQPQETTQEIEDLQLELAKSRSTLEAAEKRVTDLTHKNSEMEAQLSRKIEEKNHELQHVLKQSESYVARLRELEMEQEITRKQTEMQLVQAHQQQEGMAWELSRLQKDRKREDEFSKAFQQEFNANKVLRSKNEDLHKQLDSALDSLDALRQQQDVLKQTLLDHHVQLPFIEPEPQPTVLSNAGEAPHQEVVQHPTVAISQKPIASPGVYNQQVNDRSYMPPHSNAEFQYQEQQAQRQINWQQQQQQMISTGVTHAGNFPGTQGPPVIPHTQQACSAHQMSEYDDKQEAVVGIPPQAISRPIVPRSQHPTNTSQWPLQSRHSAGEMLPPQPAGQAGGMVHQMPMQPQPNIHPQPQDPYSRDGSAGQQPFNTAVSTYYGQGRSAPPMPVVEGHIHAPPHDYQQPPPLPLSPNLQPPHGQPPPIQSPCTATYTDNSSTAPEVPILVPVPETTPSVLQVPASTSIGGSVFQHSSKFGVGNVAGPMQPKPPMSRKESELGYDGVLMEGLSEAIVDTVAEVNENERVGDTGPIASGLQSLPQDPNLQCVVCGKVFKIGQIQNFKRHVKTCTGTTK